jgi:hypothetical protein
MGPPNQGPSSSSEHVVRLKYPIKKIVQAVFISMDYIMEEDGLIAPSSAAPINDDAASKGKRRRRFAVACM